MVRIAACRATEQVCSFARRPLRGTLGTARGGHLARSRGGWLLAGRPAAGAIGDHPHSLTSRRGWRLLPTTNKKTDGRDLRATLGRLQAPTGGNLLALIGQNREGDRRPRSEPPASTPRDCPARGPARAGGGSARIPAARAIHTLTPARGSGPGEDTRDVRCWFCAPGPASRASTVKGGCRPRFRGPGARRQAGTWEFFKLAAHD